MTIREPLPHLLSVDELAEHLGTSVRHVRRLIAERRVPYVKVGWFVRFDPDEIARWLEASRRDVTPPRTLPRARRYGVLPTEAVRATGSPRSRRFPYPEETSRDRQERRIRG